MKKTVFRKLLIAMGMTLILCLLVYPLLLPTENYFRLVLQLLLPCIFVGAVLVVPLYLISDKYSKAIAMELKKLRLDSKSTLQQYTQKELRCAPQFLLVGQSGPAHSPLFVSQVLVRGEVAGEGSGCSKKDSEAAAAQDALVRLGIIEADEDGSGPE